jgi:hypothetical protein
MLAFWVQILEINSCRWKGSGKRSGRDQSKCHEGPAKSSKTGNICSSGFCHNGLWRPGLYPHVASPDAVALGKARPQILLWSRIWLCTTSSTTKKVQPNFKGLGLEFLPKLIACETHTLSVVLYTEHSLKLETIVYHWVGSYVTTWIVAFPSFALQVGRCSSSFWDLVTEWSARGVPLLSKAPLARARQHLCHSVWISRPLQPCACTHMGHARKYPWPS